MINRRESLGLISTLPLVGFSLSIEPKPIQAAYSNFIPELSKKFDTSKIETDIYDMNESNSSYINMFCVVVLDDEIIENVKIANVERGLCSRVTGDDGCCTHWTMTLGGKVQILFKSSWHRQACFNYKNRHLVCGDPVYFTTRYKDSNSRIRRVLEDKYKPRLQDWYWDTKT